MYVNGTTHQLDHGQEFSGRFWYRNDLFSLRYEGHLDGWVITERNTFVEINRKNHLCPPFGAWNDNIYLSMNKLDQLDNCEDHVLVKLNGSIRKFLADGIMNNRFKYKFSQ